MTSTATSEHAGLLNLFGVSNAQIAIHGSDSQAEAGSDLRDSLALFIELMDPL